jgi:hypothetical protein
MTEIDPRSGQEIARDFRAQQPHHLHGRVAYADLGSLPAQVDAEAAADSMNKQEADIDSLSDQAASAAFRGRLLVYRLDSKSSDV